MLDIRNFCKKIMLNRVYKNIQIFQKICNMLEVRITKLLFITCFHSVASALFIVLSGLLIAELIFPNTMTEKLDLVPNITSLKSNLNLSIVCLILTIITYTSAYLKLKISNEIIHVFIKKTSDSLFSNYLKTDLEIRQSIDKAKLLNFIVLECIQLVTFYIRPILEIVSSTIFLVMVSIAILYSDSNAILALVVLSIFLALLLRIKGGKQKDWGIRRKIKQEEKFNIVSESLVADLELEIYDLKDIKIREIEQTTLQIMEAEVASNISAETPKLIIEFFMFLVVILLGLWVAIFDVNFEGLFLGIIVSCIAVLKAVPEASRFYRSLALLKFSQSILEEFFNWFELLEKPISETHAPSEARLAIKSFTTLESKGMSFQYGKDVNIEFPDFKIERGKINAIVGPSGSGKTTLIHILAGLLSPDNGQIIIDGKLMSELPHPEWRNLIAYVPQNPLIYRASLIENLLMYTNSSVHELDVKKILATFSLQNLPLDTKSFLGGNNLSGGQKQRLAIVRAILSSRPIIILDEPTSALDKDNTNNIMSYIFEHFKDETIIIVTHDNELAQRCGNIIRLN
jgi:ABC-type transport system involved in cytochrome bd biosynthesis fused ATPase/permease subunit